MKTLLSLFDYSGQWSQPYQDKGWNVIRWDIKLSEFMDINLIDSAETALDLFENVHGILIAVPCTEFALSGNQYWSKKDMRGDTAKAVQLVYQSLKLVDLFTPTDPDYDEGFFWSLENPVGRLPTLVPELGRPWYFNPCDFTGYLKPSKNDILELSRLREKNGNNLSNDEIEFVKKYNAYNKKTGLWGNFRRPKLNGVQPVRCAPQGSYTQRLGGKTDKTKELRSMTPEGFALAFYEANNLKPGTGI